MMARFRRGQSLRPVNRIKHVVDFNGTLTGGTQLNVTLVRVIDTGPPITSTDNVMVGSRVGSIYLRVEVASNETIVGGIPNVYMTVGKNPGNTLTLPQANAVGASDTKRYIIHQEMVMLDGLKGRNPRTLFNGVIKIPRTYQRSGPDDRLTIGILSPIIDIVACIQCHYKEFR